MSSSEPDAADLVCELDNVQGLVDALTSVRWKRQQDSVVELSEHGVVLIVDESGCLQAKVYLKRELFSRYEFNAHGRPRFGISLGIFVDSLNAFSALRKSSCIEMRYPGPDMQLLLRSTDSVDACIYADIRTTIPDTISWDYNFEPIGTTPVTFTAKSTNLKEAIDDLEWPGSSIHINLQPDPPCVTFRGEGHGDLQIYFTYYANTDLLLAFHCDLEISYRYRFASLVSVARPSHTHIDSAGHQHPSRIAFIEFFVKPEEDVDS